MSKCLRCGAGPEWLQGKIPDEQPITAALAAEREKREAWETAYKQAFDAGQQLREQLADVKEIIKATPFAHLIKPVREKLLAKIGGKP